MSKVGTYIYRGMSKPELEDYWRRVQEVSGGTYGQGPGTYMHNGKPGKGFLNEQAKKKVQRSIRKSEGFKEWIKAKGYEEKLSRHGWDEEGNRAPLGTTLKYDRHDAFLPSQQAGWNKIAARWIKEKGENLNPEEFNAADRWNFLRINHLYRDKYKPKSRGRWVEENNPYGEGNIDLDKMFKVSSEYKKDTRRRQAEKDALTQKSAPIQRASSAKKTAISSTAPVSARKEAPAPNISARIRQKILNRKAGIRT
ncbi:MAG: hypothetical protein NWE76_01450 [Candidatus Bathyarchaeota archaeon]|nr:hypothetical protein [Candidatus Bathyarchaeota archaeon]